MKKFVLFLTVVLMGVFPTVNSYAARDFSKECKIQSGRLGLDSDDNLYLNETDFDLKYNKDSSYLKCDTAAGNERHCWNNTLVFVTQKTFIGDGSANYIGDPKKTIIPFTDGPTLIQCKTGVNDKWEKVGGINKLEKCGNNAPQYTLNVNGMTIRCKRKETRGNQEYCIGSKTPDDICIGQAEAPKAKEAPKEDEQLVNCEKGYEYDPKQGDCVEKYITEDEPEETPAQPAEEKKEEPKKEEKTEPNKPAQQAKQKSGKDIFKDYCRADGGKLDLDDTRCTVTDTAEDVYLDKYKEKFKNRGKCGELKHQDNSKIWSVSCTVKNGFEGTWLIGITNIKCKSGTFNKNTGECSTTDAAAVGQKKKTPQEEFAEGCEQLPKDLRTEHPDVNFDSGLSEDGTVCTIKSDGAIKYKALVELIVEELGKEEGVTCEDLKYTKPNTYSITCTEDGFTGTVSFINAGVTCEETQTFNDDNGRCENAPAAESTNPATSTSKEGNGTGATPASALAASAVSLTDADRNKLIEQFKKEVDEIVDKFQTQAKKIKANQHQPEAN